MNVSLYCEHPEIAITEVSNISTAEIKNGLKVSTETKFLVDSAADLMIMQTTNKPIIYLGENLIYTIVVTNNGPSAATEIILNDILPEDINLVSVILKQGIFTLNNNQVKCNLGSLNLGKSTTITITITPNFSILYKNTATVIAKEYDPYWNNNTSTIITSVEASKPKYRGIEFF